MKRKKEPRFHIVKRDVLPWYRAWGIRGLSLILALVLCAAITTAMTGINPFSFYATMFTGAFGTARRTWITLQNLSILLCVSLALTPAFQMRFWNIGGEGQVLIGCLVSAALMLKVGSSVPDAVLILLMFVCSCLAGGIWGVIPAVFKAKWKTNETLFTLMMNYVATQLVAYYVIVWEVPKGSGKIGIINQDTEAGWLPMIGTNKYLLNILIVAAVTVLMYFYLRYSKHGYEIAVVGESENTARYVGISVGKVIVRTMFLSGAICGLAGFLLVAGTDHTVTTTLAGGRGFTGVMVAWLAKFNPFGMIATSLLLVFMGRGASEIATTFSLNQSYGDILTGIIIFFIIGSEFFISYQIRRVKAVHEDGSQGSSAGSTAGSGKDSEKDSGRDAAAVPEKDAQVSQASMQKEVGEHV